MSAISSSRDDDFLPEMSPSTGLVVEETYGDWLPAGREPDIMKGGVVDWQNSCYPTKYTSTTQKEFRLFFQICFA